MGLKLRRLKILRHPSVAADTELVFNDTFNVLLGQNGTGKTTLLTLISMALRFDFSPLKQSEFEVEYLLVSGDDEISVAVKNERGAVLPAVPVLPFPGVPKPDEEWDWRASVTVETRGVGFVARAEAARDGTRFEVPGVEIRQGVLQLNPFAPTLAQLFVQLAIALQSRGVALERWLSHAGEIQHFVWSVPRFDEALEAFWLFTGNLAGYQASAVLNQYFSVFVGPQAQPDVPRSAFVASAHLLPSPLFAEIQKAFDVDGPPDGLRVDARRIPELATACELMGFRDASLTFEFDSKNTSDAWDVFNYRGTRFTLTLDDGAIITHEGLSFGQKRLLAFFYFCAGNPDVVVADELVNGLHYDWIRACVDQLRGRQSFLTSQNPLLVDFLTFSSAEEVRNCFILCDRAAAGSRKRFAWRNLDDTQAASFYRAYEVGVQHVSSILRTEGLW